MLLLACVIVQIANGQSPFTWSVNNHDYYWIQTIKYATDAADYCAATYPNGYLVTINSQAEWSFIESTFATELAAESLWVSGSDVDGDGLWTYSTGPETGAPMYDLTSDRLFSYVDWCPGEPSRGEPYLSYVAGNVQYKCFNNRVSNSASYPFICEVGPAVEPFLLPVSQWGGQSQMSTAAFPGSVVFGDIQVTINLQGAAPSSAVPCSNVVHNATSDMITCTLPAGTTGVYDLKVTDGVRTYTSTYQYLPPQINTVNPSFKSGDTISITGTGFGNDATKIQATLTISMISCSNVVILSPNVAFSCVLQGDITKGLFPIKVSVGGIALGVSLKAAMYVKEENMYYNCFNYQLFSDAANEMISKQVVEGMDGYMGYVATAAASQVLYNGCAFINSNSKYYRMDSLMMNAMYNGTEMVYRYGPKSGPITLYNPVTDIGLSTTQYYYYDLGSEMTLYSSSDSYMNLLTAFDPSVLVTPSFTAVQTYTMPTNGAYISFRVTSIVPVLSNVSMSLLVNGVLSPVNASATNYQTYAMGVQVLPGSGGPHHAYFVLGGINGARSSNYLTIDFMPPVLDTASNVDNDNYITLSGNNFSINANDMVVSVLTNTNVSLTCTGLEILTPFHSVRCMAPAYFGKQRRIFITVGGKKSNVKLFNYAEAKVTGVSAIGGGGGVVTVTGTAFPTDSVTSSVSIGPYSCTSVVVDTPISLHCTLAAGSGTHNVTLTFDGSVTVSTYLFSYSHPTVSSATAVKYMVGGNVTISGDYFSDVGIAVDIQGQACANPAVASTNSLTCSFPGTVAITDLIRLGYVNVTVNTISGGAYVFVYEKVTPSDGCKNNCSGHGDCINNVCVCEEDWKVKDDCSIKGGSGGTPSTGNNTEGNYPGNFTSAITHLREVNYMGNVVKTIVVSTAKWNQTEASATQQLYRRTFDNTDAVLEVNITTYLSPATVVFGGQTIKMEANSLKYVAAVYNWTFASQLNVLQIIFTTTAPMTSVSQCKQVDTEAQMDSNKLQIVAGGSVLQAQFANVLLVDNKAQTSLAVRLLDSDPLVVGMPVGANDTKYVMTAVASPAFTGSCKIDPSFNSLISDNSQNGDSCSTSDNKWKLITIIVLCSVGGLAIACATIFIVRRKILLKKMKQDMHMRSLGTHSS
ncbi:hypothetical protein SAMD00019534_081000 [Acytostelium subglobosum LB1]|uniref:hypothetical protein n=1 Tax=Acytostelium subglobosum LB1 TaxID=1410327 RepID=UPI000644A517|nr:hypothetical protein SAMD00019534_081000 [Acytostelium subglobosum LB1]GAM24925.1 hypothetical protein SAMD00019534_081000 [Acytostelium subglobosum LB1]|eukprot:XP_012752014.1 hypothetical protein SAMD00019534_081000 [Acytostelium subglobosum LB1]